MELESFSHTVNLNTHGTGNEDQGLPPGSLEELQMELTELLKSRRGYPVSIASLPMLYYERYGKTLQAKGYFTESQRHGKAGYSLTKLLARLKNSICVIDRPHGQHSVILAEDVPKYMEFIGDKNEHGGFIASSHKIYLTFLAESPFTEQDVSNYFSKLLHWCLWRQRKEPIHSNIGCVVMAFLLLLSMVIDYRCDSSACSHMMGGFGMVPSLESHE